MKKECGKIKLFLFPPITLALIPKLSNFNTMQLALVVLVFLMSCYLLYEFFIRNQSIVISIDTIFIFCLITIVSIFSIVINLQFIHSTSYFEILKLFSFGICYLVVRYLGISELKDIDWGVKLVLIFSLMVVILQFLNISFVNIIYSMERGVSGLFRFVSSYSNPNFFGINVVFFSLVLFFQRMHRAEKVFWIAISLVLVIFSGSRSALLLYFVALMMPNLINFACKFSVKRMLFFSIYSIASCLIFYWGLINSGEYFSYLSQLTSILDNGLSSINSFKAREEIWEQALSLMNHSNALHLLVGLGPLEQLKVTDSDYVAIWVRHGIFGVVGFVTFVLYIGYESIRQFNSSLGRFTLCLLSLFLIAGFQAQIFTSYFTPILLVCMLAMLENRKLKKIEAARVYNGY